MPELRHQARRKTSIRKGRRAGGAERPARDPARFVEVTLSPNTKRLLRHFGLAPQKRFGQNFLVDEFVLRQIVDAAELSPSDQVLEVGPGLGVLTRELAERAGRVVAVEIDRGMVRALRGLFAGSADGAPGSAKENVEVVEGDALALDPGELIGHGPYKVVANIPYYITSPLLRHFFEAEHRPTRLVVLVQLEVAERIVAGPGELSLLAVSVQYYGAPRIVGRIPANAFYPQPKVDSAILRVDVRHRPAVDVAAGPFFKTVSSGFARPRKQLHNALGEGIWLPPGGAAEALEAAGIDPMRRAQTLTLEEWASLTRELRRRGAV
ncbi:MAG TPA: 16S rRNA (adenine(1518)-N(6)/adenine(1519)-N(6))-dimethyltransferase RsmA [Chloroflexota bacterium]|jgi:16S rRNA (adenine1518-N6/adenine1519-N6)-dimethyltransferase|nr:16S rRNA (adenine(1518)-N(6)/adenine(1519)-N(6))-dimethyltransferase RsmA [Chloroflexota bacterium]